MAIIFIFLVLIAWYLYLRREKAYAFTIFFFFITSGFQLIPEEAMHLMTGFSKGHDYALMLLAGCMIVDFIFTKKYLRWDSFTKYLFLFYSFLLICIIYSRFSVGCTWVEIFKTCRIYFLFLAYFVFRNMPRQELEKLIHILFYITLFISCLYLLQIILSTEILNTAGVNSIKFGDIKIMRYYNQPYSLLFMLFLAIYKSPVRGLPRLFAILVFVLAALGGLSRSLMALLILTLVLGYVIRLPQVVKVKIMIVSVSILVPAIAIIGHNFMKSRTYVDFQLVLSGKFMDTDIDLGSLQNSTFAYRLGHVFERATYLAEYPETQFLGAGLIPEDSPKAKRFNFFIGLSSESSGDIAQLETPDISYSPLIMRFGYIGAALFLLLYFYMFYFFYKKRENMYAFAGFLFIFITFGLSFFASNLLFPVTFLLPLATMNLVNKASENAIATQTPNEGLEADVV